jgi:endonuclease/exonuclease/phosphatase family metal-dependent hydrolase
MILAGDFNLSVSHWPESQIPTTKRDLAIQARLADEFGLINCWQESNPGKQPEQTLRWTGDRSFPYHCDGIFVPKSWKHKLESCLILAGDEWNRLSDHNPVVARFSLNKLS